MNATVMDGAAEATAEPLDRLTRAIHWFTVLAMLVLMVLVLIGADAEDPDLKKQLVGLHQSLGLSILLLNGFRVVWRWLRPITPLVAHPALRLAAKLSHLLVYGLLFAQPVLGWLYLSARGRSAALFGLELPALMERDRELAESLHELHEWLGWALLAVVAAHAAAALYHHYVLRDATLRRMLGRPAC